MNIDYNAVIEILKSFLNNEKIEILGISVGEERQVKDAIRNLLTAYEKEKEKNKKIENELEKHIKFCEQEAEGSLNNEICHISLKFNKRLLNIINEEE